MIKVNKLFSFFILILLSGCSGNTISIKNVKGESIILKRENVKCEYLVKHPDSKGGKFPYKCSVSGVKLGDNGLKLNFSETYFCAKDGYSHNRSKPQACTAGRKFKLFKN